MNPVDQILHFGNTCQTPPQEIAASALFENLRYSHFHNAHYGTIPVITYNQLVLILSQTHICAKFLKFLTETKKHQHVNHIKISYSDLLLEFMVHEKYC